MPPGHGKLATQRRNIRRRTKKHFDRLSFQEKSHSSNPNDIPILSPAEPRRPKSQASSHLDDTASAPVPIMMASLSNKNKRRGFKQAMSSSRPAKIVFAPVDAELSPEARPADSTDLASTSYIRLIPPSEKQAAGMLPPNVFVTSVDVEDPQRFDMSYSGYDDGDHATIPVKEDDFVLPYDDPIPSVVVDFREVQRKWDNLSLITDAAQVKVSSLVAWKVRLDPVTTFIAHVSLPGFGT